MRRHSRPQAFASRLLVSPVIQRGQVFSGPLDHTSWLRFLGEKFGDNGIYSSQVSDRAAGATRLLSVKDALDAVGTNPSVRDEMVSSTC